MESGSSRRDVLKRAATTPVLLGAAAPAVAWSLPQPGPVKHVNVVRIPMPDGVRLCGRLWLPDVEPGARVPVVLEYIPYRTRDAYSAADDHWGNTLASYGVGLARIDIRGSGDSEGLLTDEYLALEQDDALAIIAWLAAQPWCNGAVGMRGISWGGFSTLQTAMRNPPALKAIMPMACSDRRYTDDAHYIGGCLGLTNFKWGVTFKGVMAGPPDPAVAGDGWERMWRERLEASPPICARWTEHGHEDEYWKHGSLCFDYRAIRCPTYVIGGWADAYVHSVPRLLEHLTCPRKALVGPWGHTYPWLGGPGPALDWAYEEVRWWSHWLKGEPTGILDGPMLRYYCADATPSQSAPAATPGQWTAEAVWPSPRVKLRAYYLTNRGLSPVREAGTRQKHRSNNAVGLCTPEWVPFGMQELPRDQRPDDALSITYDLAPLSEDIELLGVPRAGLRVAADKPVAQLAVRLCKVLPDGTSWRLGYGLLNLTHRNGHDRPEPARPGTFYDVVVDLGFIGHRLKKGEILRLAISEGLWPLVWPSPEPVELTLDAAASSLELPVRAPPSLRPTMPIKIVEVAADRGDVTVTAANESGMLTVTGSWPDRKRTSTTGTELSGYGPNTRAELRAGQPNSCRWSGERVSRYQRGDWDCELVVRFEVTSTASAFEVRESVAARKNGRPFFEREQRRTVQRRLA